MPDDWMRKYLVIAGQAPPSAHEPPKSKEEPPVVIPEAEMPAPAAGIKPKKPARKRRVKKEFNDAAEKKLKKVAPKSKPVRKVKV